jgi:hypothetical protein
MAQSAKLLEKYVEAQEVTLDKDPIELQSTASTAQADLQRR